MIRAVVKDRRGDVVQGPLKFDTNKELESYAQRNEGEYTRRAWRLEELPPSGLTEEQLGQYELLMQLARQANGLMKHFHFDLDMVRRWKNRTPTLGDVKLLREALNVAGAQFFDLALVEFNVKP